MVILLAVPTVQGQNTADGPGGSLTAQLNEASLTLDVRQIQLADFAQMLEGASGISVQVPDDLDVAVTLAVENASLRGILDQLRTGYGVGWVIEGDRIQLYQEGLNVWVPVFDGKTLKGWEVMGGNKEAFFVEDGAIACNGQGGDWIRYTIPVSNFALRLEYKISPGGNSGIFIRSAKEGAPHETGWEVQVLDTHERGINKPDCHSAGAIYDVLTPMLNAARPADEYNSVEITCVDTHVKVEMNGYKIIDFDYATLTQPIGKFKTPYAEMPLTGYIGFQDHGSPVWYRNIEIKRLPD